MSEEFIVVNEEFLANVKLASKVFDALLGVADTLEQAPATKKMIAATIIKAKSIHEELIAEYEQGTLTKEKIDAKLEEMNDGTEPALEKLTMQMLGLSDLVNQ